MIEQVLDTALAFLLYILLYILYIDCIVEFFALAFKVTEAFNNWFDDLAGRALLFLKEK